MFYLRRSRVKRVVFAKHANFLNEFMRFGWFFFDTPNFWSGILVFFLEVMRDLIEKPSIFETRRA